MPVSAQKSSWPTVTSVRASITEPPPTMTKKKVPGGGKRRAFWAKPHTAAKTVVYRPASSSHQWPWPGAKMRWPTSTPTAATVMSAVPAVSMTRGRVR